MPAIAASETPPAASTNIGSGGPSPAPCAPRLTAPAPCEAPAAALLALLPVLRAGRCAGGWRLRANGEGANAAISGECAMSACCDRAKAWFQIPSACGCSVVQWMSGALLGRSRAAPKRLKAPLFRMLAQACVSAARGVPAGDAVAASGAGPQAHSKACHDDSRAVVIKEHAILQGLSPTCRRSGGGRSCRPASSRAWPGPAPAERGGSVRSMCSSISVSVSSSGGGACLHHWLGYGIRAGLIRMAYCHRLQSLNLSISHLLPCRQASPSSKGLHSGCPRCSTPCKLLWALSPPRMRVEVPCQEELPGRNLRAECIDMRATAPEQFAIINQARAKSSSASQADEASMLEQQVAEPCLQVGGLVRQCLRGDRHHSRNQGLID